MSITNRQKIAASGGAVSAPVTATACKTTTASAVLACPIRSDSAPTNGPRARSVIQRTPWSKPVSVATPSITATCPSAPPTRWLTNSAVVDTTTPLKRYSKKPAIVSHRPAGSAHMNRHPGCAETAAGA